MSVHQEDTDKLYMRRALRLAARGSGWTSPNPMVGAVVVRNGRIVGEGYHRRVGGAHAEVNALRQAGEAARGATLYVTLEPCNHHGRTPPCTEAVLAAGIRRVVVGMKDPNPRVSGGGLEKLRSEGVDVMAGVLEEECRALNQPFLKWASRGVPHVTLKAAATLDGRIAARTGDARWVSNEKSRRYTHRLRHWLDAILVGVGTVLADDPLLTARLPGSPCRQPLRIVLDGGLRLPESSQLVRTAAEAPVLAVCGEDAPKDKRRRLEDLGVEVLPVPRAESGCDLAALLRELGNRSVTSLLVEGGARVHGSFLDRGLADALALFLAPKILGDAEGVPVFRGRARLNMQEAAGLYGVRIRRFDTDLLVTARFREELY